MFFLADSSPYAGSMSFRVTKECGSSSYDCGPKASICVVAVDVELSTLGLHGLVQPKSPSMQLG